MDASIEAKLQKIKSWLGTGSINIFGLPMSGKDTVGVRLAKDLGGKFISSGLIFRKMEENTNTNITGSGFLAPTGLFFRTILPYFSLPELKDYPLILSSVGRWSGEENEVMNAASASGHEIKAVILLELSEEDVMNRRDSAILLGDRGVRADDSDENIFRLRLSEFATKTVPVIQHYNSLGKLIKVPADLDRDSVYRELVDRLFAFSETN